MRQASPHAGERSEGPPQEDGTDRARPKRINVAVTSETADLLDAVIEREGISLTEAVRRLVAIGGFVHRAVHEDNATVLVQTAEHTREVVLLG